MCLKNTVVRDCMRGSIVLHVKAPMGTSRHYNINKYRATHPVLSLSTLYGMLSNLAGINMRKWDDTCRNNIIRDDLPDMNISIGYAKLPIVSTLYEHTLKMMENDNYKKKLGDKLVKQCRQSIEPKRTDYLIGLDFWVTVEADAEIIRRIRNYAINGIVDPMMNDTCNRYGVLFIGSSNCMVNYIAEDPIPDELFWMVPMTQATRKKHVIGASLPVWIDRKTPENTRYGNFSIVRGSSGSAITVGPMETKNVL